METICLMYNLGTFITSQREAKGWTQRELAKRAKCSHTTINKIENNSIAQPSIDLVIGLAKAFKLPVHTLILAYQGKNPEFKTAVDGESLKLLLHNAIDQVIDDKLK